MPNTRAEASGAITSDGLAPSLQALEDAFARFAMELYGSLLPRRLRELLILHTAWQAESEWLWTAHLEAARSIGISDMQIAAIQQGRAEAFVFNSEEKGLLRILFGARGSEVSHGRTRGSHTPYFNRDQIDQIFMTECFYLNIAMGQTHCARNTDTSGPKLIGM